jgi:hypothetical protein
MIKPTPVPWVRIGTICDYAVRIVVDAVTMSTRIIAVKSGGMAMAVKPRSSRSSDAAFKPITPVVVPIIRIMRKCACRPKYCSQNKRHENFTHGPITPFCFYRLLARGNVNCRTGKSTAKISLDGADRAFPVLIKALRLGEAHLWIRPYRLETPARGDSFRNLTAGP